MTTRLFAILAILLTSSACNFNNTGSGTTGVNSVSAGSNTNSNTVNSNADTNSGTNNSDINLGSSSLHVIGNIQHSNLTPVDNFSLDDPASYSYVSSYTLYDNFGAEHQLTLYFVNMSNNEWQVYATLTDSIDTNNGTLVNSGMGDMYAEPETPGFAYSDKSDGPHVLNFDTHGSLVSIDGEQGTSITYKFSIDNTGSTNSTNIYSINIDAANLSQLAFGSSAHITEALTSLLTFNSNLQLNADNASMGLAFDPNNSSTYNYMVSRQLYDKQWVAHTLNAYYVKSGPNTWSVYYTFSDILEGMGGDGYSEPASNSFSSNPNVIAGPYTLAFHADGSITSNTLHELDWTLTNRDGSGNDFVYSFDINYSKATQYSENSAGGIGNASGDLIMDAIPATQNVTDVAQLDSASTIITKAFDPSDATSYDYAKNITLYDSLGGTHAITIYYVMTGSDTWQVYASLSDAIDTEGTSPGDGYAEPLSRQYSSVPNVFAGPVELQFSPADGSLLSVDSVSPEAVNYSYSIDGGAADMSFNLDFSGSSQGSSATTSMATQDGGPLY